MSVIRIAALAAAAFAAVYGQGSAQQTYAFTGTSSNLPGGAVVAKFTLIDAGLPVPQCGGAREWNARVITAGATPGIVRLPDGRQGDVILNTLGQGIAYGTCPNGPLVGPTRLEIYASGFAVPPDAIGAGTPFNGGLIKILYDDAPPAQPVLRPPFLELLPEGARILPTSSFAFSEFVPSLGRWVLMTGTIRCIAKLPSIDSAPTSSACGAGEIQNAANAPAFTASGGVVNGANFLAGFAANTWVSLRGVNLARTSRTWEAADFVRGALPTQLDGVQVKINGRPAFVSYISPTQLNVLAPDDPATGTVEVELTSPTGSAKTTANKQNFAPGFFVLQPQGGRYAVAQSAGTFELLAPAGLFGGNAVTRPAVPGETITLYATGFGPTTPAHPTGQAVPAPVPVAATVRVTMGGAAADVAYAGLIGPGLYQVNVTVPALPPGDAALVVQVGGVTAAATPFLAIGAAR